jgi:DNA invertase Pin-like site-specific DNA recombinase
MTSIQTGRVYVVYCRVSTDRQGRSGLGLEAQRAAINASLRPGDRLLEPYFVEVESGRKTNRMALEKALQRCQETGATLLVAKLDRLSRSVPFLRSLIDGDVDVAFCDMPSLAPGAMGRFLLTQMAAFAELEAGLISERTKAALQAAKAGEAWGRSRLPWRNASRRPTWLGLCISGADHEGGAVPAKACPISTSPQGRGPKLPSDCATP